MFFLPRITRITRIIAAHTYIEKIRLIRLIRGCFNTYEVLLILNSITPPAA